MEIDITDFVRTAETHSFSASRAELGNFEREPRYTELRALFVEG